MQPRIGILERMEHLTDSATPLCGVVVIGRNEGERLGRCLESVRGLSQAVVYVDSGSTDGSVGLAQRLRVEVVSIDMSIPFTAARARNAGFARLREILPSMSFVQFVDGDCEVSPQWLGTAVSFLRQRPDVACVCGRLRERFPERSIYNRLCDMEWNRPSGETDACGGIAMMRADMFAELGGFRETLIAGEEPELCVRIRARGARVWRVAADMALHDAAMKRFGQWWRRAVRGGYALAEGLSLHGPSSSSRDKARIRRVLAWGLTLPAIVVVLSVAQPLALLLLASYPLRVGRMAMRARGNQPTPWLWALFMVLSSFPEAQGTCKFWLDRFRGQSGRLIEYK